MYDGRNSEFMRRNSAPTVQSRKGYGGRKRGRAMHSFRYSLSVDLLRKGSTGNTLI